MKYVLITGASSGIGYEAALLFASHNKHLILIARRENELLQLKTRIATEFPHVQVILRVADLTDLAEVHSLYDHLKAYDIEAWINNAGRGSIAPYHEQDPDKMLQMIQLNVSSVALLSALYVKDYKDIEGAQLINISSLAGYNIYANTVTYNATKFFVSALTEGIAKEMTEQGAKLKAKVLAPAATETEFAKHSLNVEAFDYSVLGKSYNTAKEMAGFLYELYLSPKTVGAVNKNTMTLDLLDPLFPTNVLSGQQ